ncbi:MAG: nucleotidyl transferase AbiEii/AbiGii toxin family protein [Candidatus Marsarchaeota archaeon]|jgi:predicted nucleotidyltransferase component of viral defense system|nr:nucleotidyl transferase AbiEii/AbiGii toxin family protein [Candidatus Marsarchaeota archaeon]
MDIPIEGILTGKRLDVARMQDVLIELIYDYIQPDAILYGGTAVWRCYGGGRFSEDIDIYVNRAFEKKLGQYLQKNGMKVTWRDKELPLHIRISDGRTEVLLEAGIGKFESAISQYTKVDGSSITLSTLQPSELFVRKMEAYEGRRYIRDMYDLVHLTNYISGNDYYVISKLKPFLAKIRKPVDEKVLRSLVYKGQKDTSFEKMLDYLKRWSDDI